MAENRILAVRLSSMGDVIHTLPAVASLKHSFPGSYLAWVIDPRWAILLEDNPYVDEVILFNRRSFRGIIECRRVLRERRFDMVVDFQGLIKSGLLASAARPQRIFGFHESHCRERLAALFYSDRIATDAPHVVDKNLALARGAGAVNTLNTFPVPVGKPEGELPPGEFVLASPLGGWRSKQWPMRHYSELAALLVRKLGMPLVLNGSPNAHPEMEAVEGCRKHYSTVAGLIDATRRARAVIGIDSGPLHLAAALRKPGVAIFGPTDPARNGPYWRGFVTLRRPNVHTTYKRSDKAEASMGEISPDEVLRALQTALETET